MCVAVQNVRVSIFHFVLHPDFELLGPNKRVDPIFQESSRPDVKAKQVPTHSNREVFMTTVAARGKSSAIVTLHFASSYSNKETKSVLLSTVLLRSIRITYTGPLVRSRW